MGVNDRSEFQRAAQAHRAGFVRELWRFLREKKRWWLGPIVLLLLLCGVLIFLAGTAAAPFIYTVF